MRRRGRFGRRGPADRRGAGAGRAQLRALARSCVPRRLPLPISAIRPASPRRPAPSALTHFDPVAGDACALWCLAIDHAVRTGRLDVRVGLSRVDSGYWAPLLDEAETVGPAHYAHHNGWVVAALLGAWAAVCHTQGRVPGLHAAVAGGGDTDTVAAIAGQLLGAAYGATTVPARYRRRLHGWPGMRVRDLHRLAFRTVNGGRSGPEGWPGAATLPSYATASRCVVSHPDDEGVLLAAVGAVRPGVADAVVSLCRMGSDSVPEQRPAGATARRRPDGPRPGTDGKSVLVHCVHAQTRTPLVAAVYGVMVTGSSAGEALGRVAAVLSGAAPRPSFVRELERLLVRA